MNDKCENKKTECVEFRRNIGQKLMFLAIGGGIGVTLALLFAPKSGRELREDIADLAARGYDKSKETANEMKDRGTELFEIAKRTGSEVLDVVADGAESIKDEVTDDVHRIGSIFEYSAERAFGSGRPGIL
jgi:gas vesicle protein